MSASEGVGGGAELPVPCTEQRGSAGAGDLLIHQLHNGAGEATGQLQGCVSFPDTALAHPDHKVASGDQPGHVTAPH